MLKKFFIKRALRKSVNNAQKTITKEVKNIGKTLSSVKLPIKIKVR